MTGASSKDLFFGFEIIVNAIGLIPYVFELVSNVNNSSPSVAFVFSCSVSTSSSNASSILSVKSIEARNVKIISQKINAFRVVSFVTTLVS